MGWLQKLAVQGNAAGQSEWRLFARTPNAKSRPVAEVEKSAFRRLENAFAIWLFSRCPGDIRIEARQERLTRHFAEIDRLGVASGDEGDVGDADDVEDQAKVLGGDIAILDRRAFGVDAA